MVAKRHDRRWPQAVPPVASVPTHQDRGAILVGVA